MMRRMVAALLAIMIMISVLPASVLAATVSPMYYEELFSQYEVYVPGTQYAVGSTVWVQGESRTVTAEDVVRVQDIIQEDTSKEYEWVVQRNPDRTQIFVPSCKKVEHIVCYDSEEDSGCWLDENGKCIQGVHYCSTTHKRTKAYYLFKAVEKGTDDGFGGPGGSGGGSDGGDRIPGTASFFVHDISYENGTQIAVQGATFLLQKPDKYGNNAWQNVKSSVTDSNGKVEFYNIALDEGVEEETWRLVQQSMGTAPLLQDRYKTWSDKWMITVARAADNSFYIKSTELELNDAGNPPEHPSFYDDATNTFTVINERLMAKIMINMEFVGIETKNLPKDEEFGIDVIITRKGDSSFEPIKVEFPVEGNLGKSRWQYQQRDLGTGTYCLEIQNEYAKVPEYEQGEVKTLLSWADGSSNAAEYTTEVTTGYNRTDPIFTITNYYTYTGETPEQEISNTIIVQTKDESTGDMLPGASYGLYKSADDAKDNYVKLFSDTANNGKVTIEGLADEQVGTYVLRQHTAPEGYQMNDLCRYVKISDVDGEIQVRVSATPDQEGGEDIGTNRVGDQIVTFRNKVAPPPAEMTTVAVTFQVEVDTKSAREDAAYVQSLMDAEYPVYVKWDEGNSETMTMKAGETKTFEIEIPAGTPYEIIAGDDKNAYETVVSNRVAELTGRITGNSELTVTARYTIVNAGEKLSVKKVDSSTKTVLSGAVFALKDQDGKILKENVTSGEDGTIELLSVLNATPGQYFLEETEAPGDYEKLSGPITVNVGYNYATAEQNGVKVLEQVLTAKSMDHQNVKLEDGTFFISNSKDPSEEITVALECKVNVDMGKARTDDEYIKKLKEKEYAFYVEWDGGQSESVSLADGDQGEIKVSLPKGAPYEIKVEGEEQPFNLTLTDRNGGQNEGRRISDANLTATLQYIVEPGDYNVELTMVKVYGRNTKQTLKGAEFELKNDGSQTLKTYTTKDDGVIKIGKELGNQPGNFKLKETTSPEGYARLQSSIKIGLDYDYVLEVRNEKNVLVQNLEAEVSGSEVKYVSTDKYYVKNYLMEDNPYTGDRFNVVLWTGALVISAAGIAALLAMEAKKKRSKG